MMRVLISSVCCLFLILVATRGSAQIDDDAIPECSAEEVETTAALLREHLAAYRDDISVLERTIDLDEYGHQSDAVTDLIATVHYFQLWWQQEGEPQLPHCSLAVDVGATFGQLLDETLIAVLMLEAGYPEWADQHADPILETSDDLWDFLSSLERDSA